MSKYSNTSAGRASQRMAVLDQRRMDNRLQRNDDKRTTMAARRQAFNTGVQERLARSNKFRQEAAGVPAGTGINTLEGRQQFVVGGVNPVTGEPVQFNDTQEAIRRGFSLPQAEAVNRQAESRRTRDEATLTEAQMPGQVAQTQADADRYEADQRLAGVREQSQAGVRSAEIDARQREQAAKRQYELDRERLGEATATRLQQLEIAKMEAETAAERADIDKQIAQIRASADAKPLATRGGATTDKEGKTTHNPDIVFVPHVDPTTGHVEYKSGD